MMRPECRANPFLPRREPWTDDPDHIDPRHTDRCCNLRGGRATLSRRPGFGPQDRGAFLHDAHARRGERRCGHADGAHFRDGIARRRPSRLSWACTRCTDGPYLRSRCDAALMDRAEVRTRVTASIRGAPGTPELLAKRLMARYPGLEVVGDEIAPFSGAKPGRA